MSKRVVLSSPGRVCLYGEHMDWCGYHVLAAAVDMRTFLQGEKARNRAVQVFSYPPFTAYDSYDLDEIAVNSDSDLKYVAGVLKAFQKRRDLPYRLGGMKLRFLRATEVSLLPASEKNRSLTDLPVKKGLSSSAAMCVAISAAIDIAHRRGLDDQGRVKDYISKPEALTFYADMAYTGERKELNINCGQMDQYASAYGRILHIDCTREPAIIHPLKPKVDLPLVIGDAGPKDTQRVLAWLGERFEAREPAFIEGMNNIIRIVEAAKDEFEKTKPDRYRIGELMNENQHYLSKYLKISGDCPISPSNLDKLLNASLEAGALGAKVSGSGGGGSMIALCQPEDVSRVARAIREAGGETHISKVADEGLRVEYIEV